VSGLGPSAGAASRSAPAGTLTRRLAGSLAATLVLAAGCSGEEPAAQPPETMSPSTSPVATTSPSPTPEAPELPAAARENTKAGAVAFAHHYIDLVNHAAVSGETSALSAASKSQCRGCSGLIQSIRSIYAAGGWIRTSGWELRSWSSPGPESARERVVTLRIHMPAERRKVASGADIKASEPDNSVVNMQVAYGGGGWATAEMGLL
jgi:Family of unknown function (DUF6318)